MTEAEKRGQHRSWFVDEMVSSPVRFLSAHLLTFHRIGSSLEKWRVIRMPMMATF